jgi:flagellar protein FlaG
MDAGNVNASTRMSARSGERSAASRPATDAGSERAPAPVELPAARAGAAAQQAEAAEAARRAAEQASQALAGKGRELTFEFDDAAGRVIVRLIDTRTREVLRQVPSPELLQIARALASGIGAPGVLLNADA